MQRVRSGGGGVGWEEAPQHWANSSLFGAWGRSGVPPRAEGVIMTP